jgi:hypothetical protein
MTNRDIIIVSEGLHWWSADRNELFTALNRLRWICFGDCWHARTATIWESSAI